MSKVHFLKMLPLYYYYLAEAGIETFGVRKNDRDYNVGDVIYFGEYSDGQYTGRSMIKTICYILDNPEYCREGFVILGIK